MPRARGTRDGAPAMIWSMPDALCEFLKFLRNRRQRWEFESIRWSIYGGTKISLFGGFIVFSFLGVNSRFTLFGAVFQIFSAGVRRVARRMGAKSRKSGNLWWPPPHALARYGGASPAMPLFAVINTQEALRSPTGTGGMEGPEAWRPSCRTSWECEGLTTAFVLLGGPIKQSVARMMCSELSGRH